MGTYKNYIGVLSINPGMGERLKAKCVWIWVCCRNPPCFTSKLWNTIGRVFWMGDHNKWILRGQENDSGQEVLHTKWHHWGCISIFGMNTAESVNLLKSYLVGWSLFSAHFVIKGKDVTSKKVIRRQAVTWHTSWSHDHLLGQACCHFENSIIICTPLNRLWSWLFH